MAVGGVTIFRNPPRAVRAKKKAVRRVLRRNPPGELITERVLEIRYKHVADGKWYRHSFRPGICAMLMPDGTVVLYQKDGKPVAQDF